METRPRPVPVQNQCSSLRSSHCFHLQRPLTQARILVFHNANKSQEPRPNASLYVPIGHNGREQTPKARDPPKSIPKGLPITNFRYGKVPSRLPLSLAPKLVHIQHLFPSFHAHLIADSRSLLAIHSAQKRKCLRHGLCHLPTDQRCHKAAFY